MASSRKLRKAALLACSAAGAAAAWRLRAEPMPQEDPDCVHALDVRVEKTTTEDGIELRMKRYAREGAQPVLLVHGFFGNGLEFDLPHRGHNLALFLAERGYDVWISSFRGCGRDPYRCGVGDWHHSVDHLAALDAPALVEAVTRSTGRRPVWIGHSMGGMVLYMYLQGARAQGEGDGFRVSLDPGLAEERNRAILGGVAIGSPPGLHRGGGDWIRDLERLPFYRAASAALLGWLRLQDRLSPRVPASRIGDLVTRFPRLGRVLAVRGPIAMFLYNPDNVDPDVGWSLLKWASDNVTARMSAQIVALSQDPDFRSFRGEVNYTAHMPSITAPLFFITGTEDFVGDENVCLDAYEKVGSERKRFKCYPGYGHTDLVMGKRVREEVYPDILAWIEELCAGA
ncbi:MAG: alpha/beta fold hydrolase [Actinobacteria bacterium]|nr:alpha/beta fold hydrolase [Actinomycetota bacterium]